LSAYFSTRATMSPPAACAKIVAHTTLSYLRRRKIRREDYTTASYYPVTFHHWTIHTSLDHLVAAMRGKLGQN
jgi:hypothetical protein